MRYALTPSWAETRCKVPWRARARRLGRRHAEVRAEPGQEDRCVSLWYTHWLSKLKTGLWLFFSSVISIPEFWEQDAVWSRLGACTGEKKVIWVWKGGERSCKGFRRVMVPKKVLNGFLLWKERTGTFIWPKGKQWGKGHSLTHTCIFPSGRSTYRGAASHVPHSLPQYKICPRPLMEMKSMHASPVFTSHIKPLACLIKCLCLPNEWGRDQIQTLLSGLNVLQSQLLKKKQRKISRQTLLQIID